MVTLELFDSGAAQHRRDCSDAALSHADEAAIARYGRDAGEPFLRAMRLLPSSRRRAMEALYVFRRELADIAQGQASRTLKLALLADWRAEIARLYARQPQRLATPALRDAIERSDLRCDDFLAIIAGTEMEVRSDVRAPIFAELDLRRSGIRPRRHRAARPAGPSRPWFRALAEPGSAPQDDRTFCQTLS